MPRFVNPKKSGVHRAACLALYRALLRQGPQLPVPQQRRLQYVNQVKSKTRDNARLQGHWNITIALRLGYEVLDAVQNEARRHAVLGRIAELSARPLRRSTEVKAKALSDSSKPKPPVTTRSPVSQPRPFPLHSPVLQRPYPTVSGRRRVPKLVNANQVPMLRIRKPQSKLIGALIRCAVRTRDRRLRRSAELENMTNSGRHEDDWDQILDEKFNLAEHGASWSEASIDAHNEIRGFHEVAVAKRKRIARQMTIIVEKEERLVQDEKALLRARKVHERMKHVNYHGSALDATALAEKEDTKSYDRKPPEAPREVEMGGTRTWKPLGGL